MLRMTIIVDGVSNPLQTQMLPIDSMSVLATTLFCEVFNLWLDIDIDKQTTNFNQPDMLMLEVDKKWTS